jgi:hypothetical protein
MIIWRFGGERKIWTTKKKTKPKTKARFPYMEIITIGQLRENATSSICKILNSFFP